MIKSHFSRKERTLSSEVQATELRKNFSKSDKGALMGIGGLVSFIIQISSVGAGAILVPVLLRVVRSPKHVAGTSVTFGLVVSFIGALSHFAIGDIPMYIVAYLLIGSIPGVVLGVRIASSTPPYKLRLIFSILIFASGLLILDRGIVDMFS
jgi:uncharacterized membrane protein YfcA